LLPLILVGVNCIGIFLPTRRLDRTKHRQYHNRGVTLAAVWSSQEARWSGVGWDGYVSGDLDRPGRWKRFRASGWNLFSGKKSCRLIQGWVSVPGFGALKYDVRHTPIVIERIAKEWKLKRT